MPDAFISKVVRSGSCLEFISTACMRYRRGRPDKASRCGNPVKCCLEKTPFAGPQTAVRKTMPH